MTNVFITGATGFLGEACLQTLLESSDVDTINVLIRDSRKVPCTLKNIGRTADEVRKVIRLVVGDIKRKGLGISLEDKKRLAKTNEVYHFAANVSLGRFSDLDFIEDFYLTNVDGTRNVRDFFLDNGKIERFFHCSSAYVSGVSNETVPEEWIKSPRNPRNDYEKSKWLAEEVMRQSPPSFPLTIFRPSILCANDLVHEIPKQTVYSYAKILSRAVTKTEKDEQVRIVGEYDSVLNLTRLSDFLTLFKDIRTSKIREVIYNMAAKNNLKIGEIIDWIGEGLGFNGFRVVGRLENPMSDAEIYLDRHTGHFKPYLLGSKRLDWSRENSSNFRQNFADVGWMRDHIINYSRSLKNGRS